MADGNSRLVYSTGGEPSTLPKRATKPETAPGRGVRLRLDRRASDRVVTLVSGLLGTPQQLSRLLKELKSACGAGGTFKDGVVVLQGDQRQKIESFLRARNIPSKRAGG